MENLFGYNGYSPQSNPVVNSLNALSSISANSQVVSPYSILNWGGVNIVSTSTSLVPIYNIIYAGSQYFPIKHVRVLGLFFGSTGLQLQIFDNTNSTIIANLEPVAVGNGIYDLGLITNLPVAQANFQLLAKSATGSITIQSLQFLDY
jgi:hypothetical protein